MKKLMKLMCVFALVFVAGCGASSSTDEQKEVVTNFIDYVKECDITKLKKVASEDVLSEMDLEKMEKELSQYTEEEYGKVFVDETNKFKKAIFKDLFTDIKIKDIKADGDKTTVKVTGKQKVTDADRFAGWVHIYDPSMRELYSWRMPQSMGTPIALDFAPDNRRFASGMIAARDGQLNCSVYFMSLDSDTEGLLYTADAGSMLLRLDWQSENRVMAVFDTYIAVIGPRTAAEVARYDYGGAALQSVAPGRRQTALLLNVHGGNSLVTLSESLTVMSEIPARQAFAVSATDTDIYLLCPDAVECYGYDGVQNWVQTGLPSRPLAVLHGKQMLVFTGSQADVLAKPAE